MPQESVMDKSALSSNILLLLHRGQYAKALRALAGIQANSPGDALALQVLCHYRLDHWQEALDVIERGRGLGENIEGEEWSLAVNAMVAVIQARRGDVKPATREREALYRALHAKQGTPEQWSREARYWYGEMLAAGGEWQAAKEHLHAALMALLVPDQTFTTATDQDIYASLLEGMGQQRDQDGLRSSLPMAADRARRTDHAPLAATVDYASGVAQRLAGEYDLAQAHLNRASSFFRDQSMSWHLAHTLYELGEVALYRQQPEPAIAYLVGAHDAFSTVGAVPAAQRAEAAISWTREHFRLVPPDSLP